MDVRDLSFFEVIATTGHLGLASDRLHRTKPALTKCVRRLEAEIGGPLFSRKGRGTMLTPVGEALLVHARGMRTAMADAPARCDRRGDRPRGPHAPGHG